MQIGEFAQDVQDDHTDRMGFTNIFVMDHRPQSKFGRAYDRVLTVSSVYKSSAVIEKVQQNRVQRASWSRVERQARVVRGILRRLIRGTRYFRIVGV